MGKKNKKLKRIQESDPIVKQIKKKKVKQIIEEDNQENEQTNEDESNQNNELILNHIVDFKQEQYKPTHYSEFLKSLKIKNCNDEQINNQNNVASAKLQIKQSKSRYSKIQKYIIETYNNTNAYNNHYNYDCEQIKIKYCAKENIEIEQSEILNNFFKEQVNSLQSTLNNGISFKKYDLNLQLKEKQLIDIGCKEEDYQIDKLAQSILIDNNKFKLPITQQQDNIRLQIQDGLISNYYDYIMTDPDEENVIQFRKLYVQHIIRHLEINRETYGFTRCKILILTAFKGDAISIIDELINNNNKEIVNKDRYINEFCDDERLEEDDFRIGIQYSKQGYIKLHADFDKSDIILSSTLGLRLIVGVDGDKNRETHFLSSIEILIIDRASVMLMQNWENIEKILDVINILPNHKQITTDLSIIQPQYFENMSKFYRQNIVYTNHYFQELNYFRQHYFNNYQGCISNKIYYNKIFQKNEHFNQEFRHIDSKNQCDESRSEQFKKIWNDIENNKISQWKQTLIFIQSYFDFVSLKNYFKKINSQIECVSEYTKRNKVQSIISKFKDGRIQYIMITERAYYFEIIQLREMKNIIFYQLPQHSIIYKQLISSIKNLGDKSQLITFFNKYDAYQLETIVGTQKAEEMLSVNNKRTTFIL